MHANSFLIALGIGGMAVLGTPFPASAQSADDVRSTTGDREVRQVALAQDRDINDHQWILTGYVGPNFGEDVDAAATALGGTVTYLRNGAFGAEFMANFTPDFVFSPVELGESAVNNYMLNAIGAVPLGDDAMVQPFVSGGLGVMTIRGETEVDDPADVFEFDDAQLAGNIGAGLMAFEESWGFRADLRYFSGLEDQADVTDPDPTDLLNPSDLLGDTSFWLFSAGLGYRW
jgi:hypothetical protein